MTLLSHITLEERTNYRLGIDELRRLPSARTFFQGKLSETISSLQEIKRRFSWVFTLLSRLPDTQMNRESALLMKDQQENELNAAEMQQKKWKRLLYIPRPDMNGDASLQEQIFKAKLIPIETLFVPEKAKESESNIICLCPFHSENTPSFTIFKKTNRWYCFGGCACGGDAIDFYITLNKTTFIKAVKEME